MRKFGWFIFLMWAFTARAQSDRNLLNDIRRTILFLADDRLEGRRTGTAGEREAARYLADRFRRIGLDPLFGYHTHTPYQQPFRVSEGRRIDSSRLALGDFVWKDGRDYDALSYSGSGQHQFTSTQNLLLLDAASLIPAGKDQPHFDLGEAVYAALEKGLTDKRYAGAVVGHSTDTAWALPFSRSDKHKPLHVPVVAVRGPVWSRISSFLGEGAPLQMQVETGEAWREGLNVGGWIDNGSAQTIVLGAHYDHLGYGEDHNSLYGGQPPMIHNGADDNASGTSALVALARLLHRSGDRRYNYAFVAFSGEELGLYGSKYFTDHLPFDTSRIRIRFMINMDMVGRLNDSTRGLTIGGYGTSPAWSRLIPLNEGPFAIKVDSAGSGPSDHTSFYRKNIPVLFFFTGTHSDYHKPSDDADKINVRGELSIVRYIESLIRRSADLDSISFTKTREAATGKSSFKVSMGIMPDYTFSGDGVLVEGVSDNKPAQKAGIRAGDVIYQLGPHRFSDVQTYMQALNKMEKGMPVPVRLRRGKEELVLSVTF